MMSPDESQALAPYLTLLESFVSGEVAAPVFEQQYLERYKGDAFLWSDPVFGVLDGLFADVDAYVADDDLRDIDDGDLDDEGLRTSAASALARLQSL
jgi:hypothetical protein